MLMVGLGEAGKNIVNLFKPHTKNYKIIVLDEDEGVQRNLHRGASNLTMKPFYSFVVVVR